MKHRSIKLLFSLIAYEDLELEKMDVKIIFLYGELDEDILMEQQEGYLLKVLDKFGMLIPSL